MCMYRTRISSSSIGWLACVTASDEYRKKDGTKSATARQRRAPRSTSCTGESEALPLCQMARQRSAGSGDESQRLNTNTLERLPVHVEIGAARADFSEATVQRITTLINAAYGHHRVSSGSVRHRLRAGRNRVLHVATREGEIVGVCSSTLYVPWAGPGCGHWGLLAVAPEAQGLGVASALVAAAEARIAAAGLQWVGMEYNFHAGEPFSERMLRWYEDSLRYVGPQSRESGFRICRKRLVPQESQQSAATQARGGGVIGACCAFLGLCIKWFFSVVAWLCCGQY